MRGFKFLKCVIRFMTPEDFVRSLQPFCDGINSTQVGSANFRFSLSHNFSFDAAFENKYKEVCKRIIEGQKNGSQVQSYYKELRRIRSTKVIPHSFHESILQELGVSNTTFYQMDPFVQLIDSDGDGFISYSEYLLFVSFLKLPRTHLSLLFKVIDTSGNQMLDRDEVLEALEYICKNDQDRQHPWEHAQYVDKILLKGKEEISFNEFEDFLDQLHRSVTALQFETFDVDGLHFLRLSNFMKFISSISSSPKYSQSLMDRALKVEQEESNQDLKSLELNGISFDDFEKFAKFLSRAEYLAIVLSILNKDLAHLKINVDVFRRIVKAVVTKPADTLPDRVIHLLFNIFDSNQDSELSGDELLNILSSKQTPVLKTDGLASKLKAFLSCLSQN